MHHNREKSLFFYLFQTLVFFSQRFMCFFQRLAAPAGRYLQQDNPISYICHSPSDISFLTFILTRNQGGKQKKKGGRNVKGILRGAPTWAKRTHTHTHIRHFSFQPVRIPWREAALLLSFMVGFPLKVSII